MARRRCLSSLSRSEKSRVVDSRRITMLFAAQRKRPDSRSVDGRYGRSSEFLGGK
ncbi:hypothetical protein CMUS01_10207 [Colletotrichum musicola]|uniref:Uncharacterized protein n=1 Tax=Colletotrichum musicola TaxID=2175873 RepID=A0A8H6N8U5_9PEZI|nr:hypothetical protein CMUS01_10207 [Colletotrichum musicola]